MTYNSNEWKALTPAEKHRRIMSRLFRGDIIAGHLSSKFFEGPEKELPTNIHKILRGFEEQGYIIGYVPVLSEAGQRYFAGLSVLSAALQRESMTERPPSPEGICPYCGKEESAHDSKKVTCTIHTTSTLTTEVTGK